MKSSELLKMHNLTNGFVFKYILPFDSTIQSLTFNLDSILRDLQNLAISLYLIDRNYPELTNLNFEVYNLSFWNSSLISHFTNIFRFLTYGRDLHITINPIITKTKFIQTSIIPPKENPVFGKFDAFSLFSGGVDSTACICELSEMKKNVALNFIATSTILHGKITRLHKLEPVFKFPLFISDLKHMKNIHPDLGNMRGLIFLISEIILAKIYEISEIFFPENGPLMINPDTSEWSIPTRTSHPYLISSVQEICDCLPGTPIIINCIHANRTKSEVFSHARNHDILKNTYSCSRIQGQSRMCGICFACFVRRFSAIASNYPEPVSLYEIDPFTHNLTPYINNVKIKDLHGTLITLDNIIKDRIDINSLRHMENIPQGFFSDSNKMMKNFAIDILLGIKNHLDIQKSENLNVLGKFTSTLLDNTDATLFDYRKKELASI